MSSIVERANAEADETEAELAEDEQAELEDEAEGTDIDPELIAGTTLSEKQREQIIVRLDKENDRHTKRVAEVLGPDVSDLAPCPLCWEHAQGFVLDGVPVDEVTAAMTRQVLGMADQPEYRTNPEYTMCEVCDGLGMVLSGSKVANQEIQPCPKCKNSGFVHQFIPAQFEAPAWQPPPAPAFTPPNLAAAPGPNGDAPSQLPPPGWTPEPNKNGNDGFGRWPGHSNYGIPIERTGGRW